MENHNDDLASAEKNVEIDVDKVDIPEMTNKYDDVDKLSVTSNNDVSGRVINVFPDLINDPEIFNDLDIEDSFQSKMDKLSERQNFLSTSPPPSRDLDVMKNVKTGSLVMKIDNITDITHFCFQLNPLKSLYFLCYNKPTFQLLTILNILSRQGRKQGLVQKFMRNLKFQVTWDLMLHNKTVILILLKAGSLHFWDILRLT